MNEYLENSLIPLFYDEDFLTNQKPDRIWAICMGMNQYLPFFVKPGVIPSCYLPSTEGALVVGDSLALAKHPLGVYNKIGVHEDGVCASICKHETLMLSRNNIVLSMISSHSTIDQDVIKPCDHDRNPDTYPLTVRYGIYKGNFYEMFREGFWNSVGCSKEHVGIDGLRLPFPRSRFTTPESCVLRWFSACTTIDQRDTFSREKQITIFNKMQPFLGKLQRVMDHCPIVSYLGYSTCRICGKENGNAEYNLCLNKCHGLQCIYSKKYEDGVAEDCSNRIECRHYIFPSGLLHYYRDHHVLPSEEFYDFIMEEIDAYVNAKEQFDKAAFPFKENEGNHFRYRTWRDPVAPYDTYLKIFERAAEYRNALWASDRDNGLRYGV